MMSKEKQIEKRRIGCPMRHENGNCLVAGGFCTAVNTPICEALHNAYDTGKMHSMEEMKKQGYRKWETSEWRITGNGGYGECANCGVAPFECKYSEDLRPGWAGYCPGCGAKMLGVNNGELLTWDQLSERRARKEALYWAVSQGVCNYCDHSQKCSKDQDDEFPINAPCMVKKRDYLEFDNSEAPNAEQR